ncbi:MAG: STM4011 family radical SAM protein [Pseudomonadota bacterium]|nr:STM4011 family radical SAM protein [Pseudomonadota bacterium]
MKRSLSVLYRGSLSSCNYACGYCPFAKRENSADEMRRDADELARFVDWCANWPGPLRILFTPWGEALVRAHYRQAMIRLSHLPNVRRVAAQTHLGIATAWLDEVNPASFALWCTWHPDQAPLPAFLRRCDALRQRGLRFSVGMVALREHLDQIERLRAALPAEVPVWLNAYDQRGPGYYRDDEIARLRAIDRHFDFNLSPPPSRGAPCDAGHVAISVDGDGNARRCHFVADALGNLYDGSLRLAAAPSPCPNDCCDCFIGYVHRTDLPVAKAYAGGRLERVPQPSSIVTL